MFTALQKDFLREVQHTKSRFLSILILVALAVAFLSGLRSTAPDMKQTGDRYLDAQNLMDLQILSTLGLTEEDLAALLAREEIADGEGVYVIDAFASAQGLDIVAKVHSLTEKGIGCVTVDEGRLPTGAQECAVEAKLLRDLGLSVGDTLTLKPSGDFADSLYSAVFTITGVVTSPYYISVERGTSTLGTGHVDAYVYLPRAAFSMDAYTSVNLTVAGARELTAFYEAYDDKIDAVADALEPLADQRAALRRENLVAEATEKLDDAQQTLDEKRAETQQQLADAAQQLADADRELTDGRAAYQDGTVKLRDAKAELQDAQATLADALADLQSGEAEYQDGAVKLQDAEKDLADSRQTLADARAEYQRGLQAYGMMASLYGEFFLTDRWLELEKARKELETGEAKLRDGEAEYATHKNDLADARRELDEGWADYRDGKTEYDDGVQKCADAARELQDAQRRLSDGEAAYADAVAEYAAAKTDAETKLADAQAKLTDARRKVAQIDRCEWFVLGRSSNPGYAGFGQDADRMANLAAVFPVIFFLVAALVCLTTMTRMVEEQRVQIGALKALGYSRRAISGKYVWYGLLPCLIGSALGLFIGYTLFPTMIYVAYQIMYQLPKLELHAYWDISVFSVLAAVACTTLSTAVACFAALSASPAALMRPKSPQAGRRVLLEYIRPVWRRLSFLHKVTVRNLFRYQKRLWMTVLGIGGCTALIIAGFGLRSSLLVTMQTQYEDIYHYTAQLALTPTVSEEERAQAADFIESEPDITAAAPCRLASITTVSDKRSASVYLEVADAAALGEFVTLRDAESGAPLTLAEDGVIITSKLSELLDVGAGDMLTLDADGRVSVPIAGVTEHYIAHFVYMTPTYYETLFGAPPEKNAYLLTFREDTAALCDTLFARLMQLDGVAAATRISDTRDTYQHSMERIDFVVVIVILSAAALALVVLYNLTNINITERLRELATIKLLGFYDGEVSAYVYRESNVLTVLGIAFGIFAGHYLHAWLVRSVEIDLMMFGRATDPLAYLYAAVLTLAFMLLANLAAHRKIKRINMVESLKSAE